LIVYSDKMTIFVIDVNSFGGEMTIVTETISFNDELYSSPMCPGFRHNMLFCQAAKRHLPRWQLTCFAHVAHPRGKLTWLDTWQVTWLDTWQLTWPVTWRVVVSLFYGPRGTL
jgi:hypothetical protein